MLIVIPVWKCAEEPIVRPLAWLPPNAWLTNPFDEVTNIGVQHARHELLAEQVDVAAGKVKKAN